MHRCVLAIHLGERKLHGTPRVRFQEYLSSISSFAPSSPACTSPFTRRPFEKEEKSLIPLVGRVVLPCPPARLIAQDTMYTLLPALRRRCFPAPFVQPQEANRTHTRCTARFSRFQSRWSSREVGLPSRTWHALRDALSGADATTRGRLALAIQPAAAATPSKPAVGEHVDSHSCAERDRDRSCSEFSAPGNVRPFREPASLSFSSPSLLPLSAHRGCCNLRPRRFLCLGSLDDEDGLATDYPPTAPDIGTCAREIFRPRVSARTRCPPRDC